MKQETAVNRLSGVQRFACLGITRAIRSTPTAALQTVYTQFIYVQGTSDINEMSRSIFTGSTYGTDKPEEMKKLCGSNGKEPNQTIGLEC